MKDLANSHEGPSGNMYTYQEDKKSNIIESNALRRSLGGNNPNLNPNYYIPENVPLRAGQDLSPDTVTIHIDQSPPLYWMFFIVFMIIQIIILLFIGFYYQWDDDYTSPKSINTNSTNNLTLLTDFLYNDTNTYGHIKYKYKLFQEVNIMIFF